MSDTAPRPTRAATVPNPDGIAIVDRRLVIEGEPFLVLGGELHNSSASTPADLDSRWERLTALGMNTALAPICWELVEPEEGRFDFTTVDALIDGARAHGLRLVPLWFGSWKNGLSSYRPAWVKRDPARFPLVERADGGRVQVLSTFSSANRDADAAAFAAVMRHIREHDEAQKTVVMVQVENEVGILGASRDHGTDAAAAWQGPVDPALVAALRSGDFDVDPAIAARLDGIADGAGWASAFGDGDRTDELFQALGYAGFVDAVVAAGRAEYELPYFVNTWLDAEGIGHEWEALSEASGGQRPGVYPSGGPLPQVHAAWSVGAPNVTLLTPDIYRGDFADWCARYARTSPGFFIPEMRKTADGVADAHVAIGSHGAIGVSPFGIDGLDPDYRAEDRALLADAYAALASIAPLVLAAQSRGEIVGFHLTDDRPTADAEFAGYRVHVKRDLDNGAFPGLGDAWGLVLADGEGGFVGTGNGVTVTFERPDGGTTTALERAEAGVFVDGAWRCDQVLNGDETLSGELWRIPYFEPAPGAAFGEFFPRARVLRAWLYDY
jgi:hypothetical protein